jgi:GT2 family glycosyltransferase
MSLNLKNVNKLVSINILTYNGQDLIEPCLNSVLKQTYPNIEILIIDNASTDNTLKVISKFVSHSQIGVGLIENKKNLGFATGHNIGIKQSRGGYVLCLNQDIVLDKNFVKYAVEAMEKNDKIGSVQCKLLKIRNMNRPKSNIIDSTGLLAYKNRRIVSRGQGEKDKGQYKKGEIFGVDGAAPLYRRKALEDIKIDDEYFDEDFFAYKEDVDLAWRLRLYEWKAVYQPKAVAYHLRTAGEKAVRNYISVAKERRKLSKFAKFHSFKNDRLMRIKNELPDLFLRDILYIIIKEIGAWAYVLFFERYTWKAIKSLIKQTPDAWRKRKLIMKNKKIDSKQISKWFV